MVASDYSLRGLRRNCYYGKMREGKSGRKSAGRLAEELVQSDS